MNIKNFKIKTFAVIFTLATSSHFAFAEDKDKNIYTQGISTEAAGDFIVEITDESFFFQDNAYEVYSVSYDNAELNTKIAVNIFSDSYTYIVIGEDYKLFYENSEEGFGVRRVKFANLDANERFDAMEFSEQSILSETRQRFKKKTIDLIISNLPDLKS